MGENIALKYGFETKVIEKCKDGSTTSEDTIAIAKKLLSQNIDLLLFAGGDGTARNIYEAIGGAMPVVGIPNKIKGYNKNLLKIQEVLS